MNIETFISLTKDVTVTRAHPNYFLYDGDVCKLICTHSRTGERDFALRSICEDRDGYPYVEIPLVDIDENNIKILVAKDVWE